MKEIVWYLEGNLLKVAECEYNCMVVRRKASERLGILTPWYGRYTEIVSKLRNISIPLCGSYKESVSKLQKMNIIVWQLQGDCLRVAEYEYRFMVVTRKSSQSRGIRIAFYGSYKESDLKYWNMSPIVWQLEGNRLRVAEYEYCCMEIARKSIAFWRTS